jgi:2-methylcitrate dehydratase PrpD
MNMQTTNASGLTTYVAGFVTGATYEEVPTEVVALAKKSILDGIGLALSGAASPAGRLAQRYVAGLGASGTATVIGSDLRVAPRFAAFANGIAIHADDYDDTQLAAAPNRVYGLLTHPTAPALPAALALGEATGASGQDVLMAYLVGIEVECKIAEAIDPRHYRTGFHTTGTCGGFAAAAAGARLLGLDRPATARALSLAASQAAGLRENFGTMTKPFHAGRASESGVAAAELAGIGWTATDRILEAPRGFFSAAGGGYDPTAILGRLGDPWTFAAPGISIKPYPSGSLTHPGMTEMARLIREHAIAARDVVRVRVGTNSHMPNTLIHRRPRDELEAKFSMEFCMAILLLEGRAGLDLFKDEVVTREDVRAMVERIDFVVDDEAERAGYDKMTTLIDIHLADGRRVSGRADFGKGSPDDPMSLDEVADKLRGCAAFARFPRARADEIIGLLAELERLPGVSRLTDILRVTG